MISIGLGQTHVGKRREQNEDSFTVDDELGRYAVSDGTGGHTVAAELARSGVMSPAEIRDHQYAHALTRAIVPQEAVRVDTLAFVLHPNDQRVLCSDGLRDYIEAPSWIGSKLSQVEFDASADVLIDHANEQGGGDTITVIVVRFSLPADEQHVEIRIADRAEFAVNAISAVPRARTRPWVGVALLERIGAEAAMKLHSVQIPPTANSVNRLREESTP